jgi:acid phosphatase (class A)
MLKFVLSVFILVVAVTELCFAQSSPSLSTKPYISASDVDYIGLIPAPPAENSPTGKLDLQAVLDQQKGITPERIAAIQFEDTKPDVYKVIGDALGPRFKSENFPFATAFFDKVHAEKGIAIRDVKRKYKKVRPFQYSKDVSDYSHHSGQSAKKITPTYPGGHCTFAAEAMTLMDMMLPEKRDALSARSWEYDRDRLAVGATYPSDCEAGHIAASLAVSQMLKNPEFQSDFEAAKAELRKGLDLP